MWFTFLAAHRGTEEQCAVFARDACQDAVEVLLKAHREHLVRLVEHHVLHSRQVGHASLHQVHEAARSSHDDVNPVPKGANLRLDVRAAIDGQDAHLGQVLAEALQVVGNLQAQLARRAQDDRPYQTSP